MVDELDAMGLPIRLGSRALWNLSTLAKHFAHAIQSGQLTHLYMRPKVGWRGVSMVREAQPVAVVSTALLGYERL